MTKIIAGFAGSGKTTTATGERFPQYRFVDLDSSNFDKSGFPQNYLDAVKIHVMDQVDFVFVSTHPEVIQGIIDLGYDIHLVYPEHKVDARHEEYARRENEKLKGIFMDRYKSRGDTDEFISFMDENFWNFVSDIESVKSTKATHHKMNSILDDMDFFVWKILGTKGFENNLVSDWDGWDEDGHTLIFHNAVLNKESWGSFYYTMLHDKKTKEFSSVSIDTEYGFVTVYDQDTDKTYNYNFGISLQKS